MSNHLNKGQQLLIENQMQDDKMSMSASAGFRVLRRQTSSSRHRHERRWHHRQRRPRRLGLRWGVTTVMTSVQLAKLKGDLSARRPYKLLKNSLHHLYLYLIAYYWILFGFTHDWKCTLMISVISFLCASHFIPSVLFFGHRFDHFFAPLKFFHSSQKIWSTVTNQRSKQPINDPNKWKMTK